MNSDSDPHTLYADPDPGFYANTDPNLIPDPNRGLK
jgi:hypothetical protein